MCVTWGGGAVGGGGAGRRSGMKGEGWRMTSCGVCAGDEGRGVAYDIVWGVREMKGKGWRVSDMVRGDEGRGVACV